MWQFLLLLLSGFVCPAGDDLREDEDNGDGCNVVEEICPKLVLHALHQPTIIAPDGSEP
jgi:hypothetical protein